MSDYNWPTTSAFTPRRFQMRTSSNTRTFTSPYTNGVQVVDLMADFWMATIDLNPGNDQYSGGQIEAFFDRLKGATNRIVLWNLRRPAPLGTMRGSPTLGVSVTQLANTATIVTIAGQTLLAGDMIGMGGQLVRVMADAVADGSGNLAVEFAPRTRAAISSGAAVAWDKPTANFILASNGAPVDWSPGEFTAPSIDLRESF